jgi:hypothetical protein
VGDDSVLIDLSSTPADGQAPPPVGRPWGRRGRALFLTVIGVLAIFGGLWIPAHDRQDVAPVEPGRTIAGIPLVHGGGFQISGDSATHLAQYRFPLTNAGSTPLEVERLYVLVPGLVFLQADPPHASIAARHSQLVTLTFQVSDCSDVLGQRDSRSLRVVVRTAWGPVEWQVDLASRSPDELWQVAVAAAACPA